MDNDNKVLKYVYMIDNIPNGHMGKSRESHIITIGDPQEEREAHYLFLDHVIDSLQESDINKKQISFEIMPGKKEHEVIPAGDYNTDKTHTQTDMYRKPLSEIEQTQVLNALKGN